MDVHLTEKELAFRWKMSPRTLQRWRWAGSGPDYLKLGGKVVYREDDVRLWEENHRVTASVESGEGCRGPDESEPA
jgi:predicted site-specific integrase-resolvase